MGSNNILFGTESNRSDGNLKKSEAFFKQLAENHSLHQKLESISWIAEDEYRGLAILSRTLFLFTMDIRDERDKAKEDFARTVQELGRVKSILCSSCKQNVPQEEKENCIPEQDTIVLPVKLGTAKGSPDQIQTATLDRRELRDLKISNKEYRRLSRSPKKKNTQTSLGKLSSNAPMPRHCLADQVILAPETQTLDVPVTAKEPVDGRTSIPETMVMEDDPVTPRESYRNTDFFDDSKDVFDDSSCGEEDSSECLTGANKTVIDRTAEPLTYTHISPVLGRGGSGSKDSPFREKLRSLNDGFSSSSSSTSSESVSQHSISQNNANTAHSIPNVVTSIQAKYQADINASPITSKIVNITVSPNCQSEVELQSPSLLNVVPQRKYNSQPTGSQISINCKSPYKYNSNKVPPKMPKPINIYDKNTNKDIPSANLPSSKSCENELNKELHSSSSVEVISTDGSQNDQLGKNSSDFQSGTLPEKRKQNSSAYEKQLDNKASTSISADNTSMPVKSVPSSEHCSAMKPDSVSSNHPKKDFIVDEGSSAASGKACKPSGRVLGGNSTKACTRSLSVAGADSSHGGKKNMTRHQSHTVMVHGSKLYNKIEVNPVAATVKKNYKQTKLTAESFFAPKKRGNLDASEDPLLAVAVAKSLETKELDDRRRLQLHHPALRQLQQQDAKPKDANTSHLTAARQEPSSQCQGWLKPAGKKKKLSGGRLGSPLRSKRKSNEGAGDAECRAPDTSDQATAKRARLDSPSHDTMLTESQMMGLINGSSAEEGGEAATPMTRGEEGGGTTGTPMKQRKEGAVGTGTPITRGAKQDKGKRSTPKKRDKRDGGRSVDGDGPSGNEGRKDAEQHLGNGKRRLYAKPKSPTCEDQVKHDLQDETKSGMGPIGLAAASLCRRRQAEVEQRDHKGEVGSTPKKKRKSGDAVTHADKPLKQGDSRGAVLVEQETRKEYLVTTATGKRKARKGAQTDFNDSFDRLPAASNSPGYAYAGPVERNQAKRRQMQGWSCKQCKEYYEGRDLTEEQLADHMNRCSKHRSKHQPLVSTPQGYWDPEMTYTDSDS